MWPPVQFVLQRAPELWQRLGEHLALTGIATLVAILVGIPMGIWIARSPRARGWVLGLTSAVQTIPSLALLAFLLPFLGIGARPAIAALILYALLPIVRNTYTGLTEVPADVREAAEGVGFTVRQQLWMVEIPLALPVIVAGIRTATVISVGVATLAAAIGAGGLGVFIFQGLAMVNTPLVLLGAVPAAALALLLDAAIGAMQDRALARRSQRSASRSVRKMLAPAVAALLLFGVYWLFPRGAAGGNRTARVVVGSKNFTEQYLLGELMAQLLENRTHLEVVRRMGLGGTLVAHKALAAGDIDLYAEYTGTALTAILQRPALENPHTVFQVVSALYEDRHRLTWLAPFGFNNTYALTVRTEDAKLRGWKTISDLQSAAPSLHAGFPAEFSQRPDGYSGLRERYGYSFRKVSDMDPGLMYGALAKGEVDVIAAFATDGRIPAFKLTPLLDDRRYFPPYFAAPVVRMKTLEAHPEIRTALSPLADQLSDPVMQRLNYEVDEKKREPAEVAREFLAKLVSSSSESKTSE